MPSWLHQRIRFYSRTLAIFCFILPMLGEVLPSYWLADNLSHFRIYYFSGALCAGIGFALIRALWTSGLTILYAAALGALSMPTFPKPIVDHNPRLQVLSYNLLYSNTEKDRVVEMIKKELAFPGTSIVFLMEVKEDWARALQPIVPLAQWSFMHSKPGNFGFAVFCNRPVTNFQVAHFDEWSIPSATGEIEVDGQLVKFIGAHLLPPTKPESFAQRNLALRNLSQFVKGNDQPLVLMGDWNITPWSHHFRELISQKSPSLSIAGSDGWYTVTWQSSIFAIPIDYILYSNALNLGEFKRLNAMGSDHYPIRARFSFHGQNAAN